jgi:hypothetical protein
MTPMLSSRQLEFLCEFSQNKYSDLVHMNCKTDHTIKTNSIVRSSDFSLLLKLKSSEEIDSMLNYKREDGDKTMMDIQHYQDISVYCDSLPSINILNSNSNIQVSKA